VTLHAEFEFVASDPTGASFRNTQGGAFVSTAVAMAVVFLLAASAGSNAVAHRGFDLADVRGRYLFSFDGEIVGAGPVPLPVAASGYLVADGNGSIYEARRTISSPFGVVTEAFTCTLTLMVDADGMGSAECELDEAQSGMPSIETFDFVITRDRQSFRFVGTTPGLVVSGSGHH